MINIKQIYNTFHKYITKYYIIALDESFKDLLNSDYIMVDENTKSSLNQEKVKIINDIFSQFDSTFIKLNNKAAIDAEFMSAQLKCFNLDDLIVLIKGSQRMIEAFNSNNNNENFLIMKEWYKIEHKNEFTCFIINNNIKGITQRYIDVYENYDKDYLISVKKSILSLINEEEFKNKIKMFTYDYCIIDFVYLPKKVKVKIIDIEFFHKNDDNSNRKLKLYKSWDELENNKTEELPFKVIESEKDPNIVLNGENENMFPLELYETNIQTLIDNLNLK